MLERKDFHGETATLIEFDRKDVSDSGEFEGYASVFGVRDQGDDIVSAGAFAASLVERPVERVKMLWQHDPGTPIGKWLEMREDTKGLYAKGRLFLATQKGKEVHEFMKEGAVDGLSIGYRTRKDEWDSELGVRRLLDVSLREVSVVTFPMLESATVTLVKGDKLPTEREFERFLMREAGFSAQQAKGIIAHGYKSLSARDAGDDEGLLEAIRGLRSSLT